MPQSKTTLDNLGTELAPTWRARRRLPLTNYTIRLQLLKEAAALPERDRRSYIARRLTALDKAVTDDEAAALQNWLDCESLLSGRTKSASWGDRTGGVSRYSPVPDWAVANLKRHASMRKQLDRSSLRVLAMLSMMMESPEWDYAAAGYELRGASCRNHRHAQRLFIQAVANIAEILAAAN